MSAWIQVVEALPESGKKVLAFFKNELGNGRRICTHYTAPMTLRADEFCWDNDTPDDWFDMDESGESYVPEGWYEECETQEDCRMVDMPITHWMPLPEMPV